MGYVKKKILQSCKQWGRGGYFQAYLKTNKQPPDLYKISKDESNKTSNDDYKTKGIIKISLLCFTNR